MLQQNTHQIGISSASVSPQMKKVKNNYPALFTKMTLFYLYFIQGIFFALPGTLVYLYQKTPTYAILSVFALAYLPFSFKFLFAPFIEKYNFYKYGKRKTWIVFSLLCCSLVLYQLAKVVSKQKYQQLTAVLLIVSILIVAIGDVATDALAIKQLMKPQLISLIQMSGQQVGRLFGSIFFYAMVSKQIWVKQLKFSEPLMSARQFILGIMMIIVGSLLVIHNFFREKVECTDAISKSFSIGQIIKEYRYFFDWKYRLFREAFKLLILYHGLIYFTDSFDLQLVKQGFIIEQISFITNCSILPSFITCYFLAKFVTKQNVFQWQAHILKLRLFLCLLFYILSPTKIWHLWISYPLLYVAGSVQYYVDCALISTLSEGAFEGMNATMCYSFLNLGRNSTLQLHCISKIGRKFCIIFGFAYTLLLCAFTQSIQSWTESGQPINYQKGSRQKQAPQD